MSEIILTRYPFFLTLVLIAIFSSCQTYFQSVKNKCLKEKIDFILMTDYEVLLKPKHELLLILNFEEINGNTLKAAVFPKKLFSRYPFKNEYEKPKGYLTYKNVIILIYGNPPDSFKTKPLNKDLKNLIAPPTPITPKEGNPPFPPALIEPVIYTFSGSEQCYSFIRSTVADFLFR